MQLTLMARCPMCTTTRILWGPITIATRADLIAAETLADIKGHATAICPQCGIVEEVALFDGDHQTEPWMDAEEYERLNGPDAGPLPPIPDLP